MSLTTLHPPVTPIEIKHDPRVDGEYLINIGGVVEIMKTAGTPQARQLYRLYLAEYRALEGQPLTHQKREEKAMLTAFERAGFNIVSLGELK